MRINTIIELVIKTGRFLGYMKGAYESARDIIRLVADLTGVNETLDTLDDGLGL